MDLKEIAILGSRASEHWYYRAKLEALFKAVDHAQSVLDIGSGSGLFPRRMLEQGKAESATCVDPGYDADSDETVANKPLAFRRSIDQSDADLVLMMDVLEHVPDDAGLVSEYAAKVASGTRFFVSVPAFQWLWSGHDVFLEHYRRYTVPMLETMLRKGGLVVDRGFYFYGALFPVAAVTRLAPRLRKQEDAKSALKPVHPVLNSILLAACRAELPLFERNRVAGLTAMALAHKP